jgi:hypothetical protein
MPLDQQAQRILFIISIVIQIRMLRKEGLLGSESGQGRAVGVVRGLVSVLAWRGHLLVRSSTELVTRRVEVEVAGPALEALVGPLLSLVGVWLPPHVDLPGSRLGGRIQSPTGRRL